VLPYIGPEFIAHLLKWDQIGTQVLQEQLTPTSTSARSSSVLVGPQSQSTNLNTGQRYKDLSHAFKAYKSTLINRLFKFLI
jgi:hypothetical protein